MVRPYLMPSPRRVYRSGTPPRIGGRPTTGGIGELLSVLWLPHKNRRAATVGMPRVRGRCWDPCKLTRTPHGDSCIAGGLRLNGRTEPDAVSSLRRGSRLHPKVLNPSLSARRASCTSASAPAQCILWSLAFSYCRPAGQLDSTSEQ